MTNIWSLRPKKYLKNIIDTQKNWYVGAISAKMCFCCLLITSSLYPKKHIVSGRCKFLAIFHFTPTTDVLSESHFEFHAKITCNFRSQKTIVRLFGKKKMAKVRYQIIPLIFSFILGGVFCDTLDSFAVQSITETPPKKNERYPFNTLLLAILDQNLVFET